MTATPTIDSPAVATPEGEQGGAFQAHGARRLDGAPRTFRGVSKRRRDDRRSVRCGPWPGFLRRILANQRDIELAEAQARREIIQRGPPTGSGITPENWQLWHECEYFVCPRSKCTCIVQDCRVGASCRLMRAIGLTGDGRPLARKLRPVCGARNRRGEPCAVKVVPGKCRCRFHGGLSTGPRTIEGRARIAAAQRLRWARQRGHKIGAERGY
jgi:hypothetical protein